jgi:hypothetical protein
MTGVGSVVTISSNGSSVYDRVPVGSKVGETEMGSGVSTNSACNVVGVGVSLSTKGSPLRGAMVGLNAETGA